MAELASKRLLEVLNYTKNTSLEATVNIQEINIRLLNLINNRARLPFSVSYGTDMIISYGVLLSHINNIACNDVLIRDLMTSGHLGKLLYRWHIMDKVNNYKVLGLPHDLFDLLSREELIVTINENKYLYSFDYELLNIKDVIDMIKREDCLVDLFPK